MRASCLPLHVVLSVAVTNLLVVVESDISSASNTTAQVWELTLDTGAVGIAHQSFIIFPVAQSNTARCQSVLLAGHTTSQLQLPDSHLGIPKFNTAALEVPTLVTVAELHAGRVVVVPTVIVAASQSSQSVQGVPATHCGMEKFNTAALDVHTLVTVAELPAAQVDTVQTVIVAAAQSAPGVPGFHRSVPYSASLWRPRIPFRA